MVFSNNNTTHTHESSRINNKNKSKLMLVRHKVWNLPHGLPIVALLLLLSRDLISHPAQQRMTRRKRMQRKRTSCAQLPTKLRSSPKNDSCNGGRLYDYE